MSDKYLMSTTLLNELVDTPTDIRKHPTKLSVPQLTDKLTDWTATPAMSLRATEFRNEELGKEITEEQLYQIRSGQLGQNYSNPEDRWHIGDCWYINGVTWRIADAGVGNSLIVVPDEVLTYIDLFPFEVNQSSIPSKLADSENIISNAFGDIAVSHTCKINNTDVGPLKGWPLTDKALFGMTCVYAGDDSFIRTDNVDIVDPYLSTTPLALFNHSRDAIYSDDNYWVWGSYLSYSDEEGSTYSNYVIIESPDLIGDRSITLFGPSFKLIYIHQTASIGIRPYVVLA